MRRVSWVLHKIHWRDRGFQRTKASVVQGLAAGVRRCAGRVSWGIYRAIRDIQGGSNTTSTPADHGYVHALVLKMDCGYKLQAYQPSLPFDLNEAQRSTYPFVRSKTGCGRLVARTMLRTLTAPSLSMSLRTVWSRDGENCRRYVSISPASPARQNHVRHTSEYHRYCQATSRITHCSTSFTLP